MRAQLLRKLQDKSASIGIVGLGYVGLPLAKLYLQNGFLVYGFDIDEKKVAALMEGRSYIEHVDAAYSRRPALRGHSCPLQTTLVSLR
ncbi:NAD(P)-binding domain-containing protein [Desulfocurvibacter africanus]|uniref:NAD(P)-binding domain-containing protein n=1 Tax=Desulfocurvibacter africanus TaxID=873 RepID=UPI0023785427|nr:NAD(P)-binding domain-containing protein [Desulfocurvibacter africanus]